MVGERREEMSSVKAAEQEGGRKGKPFKWTGRKEEEGRKGVQGIGRVRREEKKK